MSSKKLLKRRSTKKGESETNPYSGRGADKLSALLAEMEEKKRLVYSQFEPEEVSLIRFVDAGDNKLVPLVVRAKSSGKLACRSEVFEAREEKAEEGNVEEEDGMNGQADQELEKEMEVVEPEETIRVLMPFPGMSYKVAAVAAAAVMVAVIVIGIGRSWKSYWLVQIQDAVCPSTPTPRIGG